MKTEKIKEFINDMRQLELGSGPVLGANLMGLGFFLVRCGAGALRSVGTFLIALGLTLMEFAVTQQVHLESVPYREAWRRYIDKCGNLAQEKLALRTAEDECQFIHADLVAIDVEIANFSQKLEHLVERNFNLPQVEEAAIAHVLEGYAAGVASNRSLLGR